MTFSDYCDDSVHSCDLPAVYVIVVNWNNWRETLECLARLIPLGYRGARILVVDNGSHDNSEAYIRDRYPDIDVLQTGANLGYGGGNNAGIELALGERCEYVWILNNDTRVVPGSLMTLVEIMQGHPRLGILGPTAYYPHVRAVEPKRDFPPGLSRPGGRERSASGLRDPRLEIVDYVSGSSLLLRRQFLEEVGTFDLGYFHFWEDADLCWRAWQHGWLVARTRECHLSHRPGGSTVGATAMVTYYATRNRLRFYARARSASIPRIMLHRDVLPVWAASLLGLRGFLHPRVKMAAARAIADALRGRAGRSARYSPW